MEENQKKIAVLIRSQRSDEALRMGVGITLEDDIVDLFFMDKKIDSSDKSDRNVLTADQMDQELFTNNSENGTFTTSSGHDISIQVISNAEIAEKLLECDHILPY